MCTTRTMYVWPERQTKERAIHNDRFRWRTHGASRTGANLDRETHVGTGDPTGGVDSMRAEAAGQNATHSDANYGFIGCRTR
jgi:hypothetical protein